MVVLLLVLMSYTLVADDTVHEWLGISLGIAVTCHLVLNRKWFTALRKGKYTPSRILRTVVDLCCLGLLIGLVASGVTMSNRAVPILHVSGSEDICAALHMLCAYWSFVAVGLHIGLHWDRAVAFWHRRGGPRVFRFLGWAAAGYGVFAFFQADFPDYLFLRTHFLMLGPEVTPALFFMDYAAIMALFILAGYYGNVLLKNASRHTAG